MPFQLEVLEQPGYLHCKITGDNTEESVRGYLRAIHEMAVASPGLSILVEEHLRGPSLDTVKMFQIATEGSMRSRSLIKRVAYVDTNPEHPAADVKFVESVAANRGMNVRAFRTVADAAQWLISP